MTQKMMRVPASMVADPGLSIGGQFFRFEEAPDDVTVKVVVLPDVGEYADPLGRLGFEPYDPAAGDAGTGGEEHQQ